MQFTRFTDYSLRALMYLAKHPDRLCNVKEIAVHYNISQNHLVKIIHNLSILKYIESVKGKYGGVRLLKSPETINLGDIILQLEPNMNFVECFDERTNTCKLMGACGLQKIFLESSQAFMNVLRQHTLADIVKRR